MRCSSTCGELFSILGKLYIGCLDKGFNDPGYHRFTQFIWNDFNKFRIGPRTTPSATPTGPRICRHWIHIATVCLLFSVGSGWLCRLVPRPHRFEHHEGIIEKPWAALCEKRLNGAMCCHLDDTEHYRLVVGGNPTRRSHWETAHSVRLTEYGVMFGWATN